MDEPTLFERSKSRLPRQITVMHARHGRAPVGVCGECQHLHTAGYRRTYVKCACYGTSHSTATDWRKRWPACGLLQVVRKARG